ncbi:MAG: hypothetical protein KGL39_12130 [Patescibacteria group bacterium]|nr:hypothetical protein [Patescibacteria group bacterium]
MSNNGTEPKVKFAAIQHICPAPANWFAYFAMPVKEGSEELELVGRPIEAIQVMRQHYTNGQFADVLCHICMSPDSAGVCVAELHPSFRTVGYQPPTATPAKPGGKSLFVPR